MKLAELLLKYDRKKMAQNNSNVSALELEVFSGNRPSNKDSKKKDKKKKKLEYEFR